MAGIVNQAYRSLGGPYDVYVPSLLPLMLCIDGTFITTGEHHGRRFAGASCLILANKHN